MINLRRSLIVLFSLCLAWGANAQQVSPLNGLVNNGTAPTDFNVQPLQFFCNNATPSSGQCWPLVQLYNSSGILSATNGIFVTPTTGATMGVTGTFWQTTQPVSGTVTVNGTLTANLGTLNGAATAANQEVTAAGTSASSAQGVQGVTSGVPFPTQFAPDPTATTGAISIVDTGSTCTVTSSFQTGCTGTPTTGSYVQATIPPAGFIGVIAAAATGGTPNVVLHMEVSQDGTTWYGRGIFLDSNPAPVWQNSLAPPFAGLTNAGGLAFYRVRATTFTGSGSVAVTIRQGQSPSMMYVGNLPNAAVGTASVSGVNIQGSGVSGVPVGTNLQQLANTTLCPPTAWGTAPVGCTAAQNVNANVVAGTITTTNASVGATGSAAPGSATYNGMLVSGGNMVGESGSAWGSAPTGLNVFGVNADVLSSALPTGAATAANQEVTAAGTSATSAQAIQGVTGGVPIPVSGSFSASFSQFAPNGTVYGPLSVGATSANVAITGSPSVIEIDNTGANAAFVALGVGSGTTATSSSAQIAPGGFKCFGVGSNTYLAAIETAGTTALNIAAGTGGCAGSGGGGSSVASDTTLSPTGTISAANNFSTGLQVQNYQNGRVTLTGTATSGSILSFTGLSGWNSGTIECTGAGTQGTNQFEVDVSGPTGGTLVRRVATATGPTISVPVNLAGQTFVNIVADQYSSGSPTCQMRVSVNQSVPDDYAVATQADLSAPVNFSTVVTTQIIAAIPGQALYITSWDAIAAGTTNVTWEYGSGSLCGTGTTALTGAYPLTAQAGESKGGGLGAVFVVPPGDALCAVNSAAVQVSGSVSYAQR